MSDPAGTTPETRLARHPAGAWHFLQAALLHAQRRLDRESHVSGRELLDAVRDLAIGRYGPAARMVLEHWGIRRTEDVGEMVRALVEATVWSARAEDRWEDFADGFDFRRAFEEEYPWAVKEALRPPAR